MIDTTAQYILFFSLFCVVNTAGADALAAEDVDPLPVEESPVMVVETWHLGPCDWTGKREGAQLINASGRCGQIRVFAAGVSREPAQAEDIVVMGPFGVVSAASATWIEQGLQLVNGAFQSSNWTMKGSALFIGFSDQKVVLEPPIY